MGQLKQSFFTRETLYWLTKRRQTCKKDGQQTGTYTVSVKKGLKNIVSVSVIEIIRLGKIWKTTFLKFYDYLKSSQFKKNKSCEQCNQPPSVFIHLSDSDTFSKSFCCTFIFSPVMSLKHSFKSMSVFLCVPPSPNKAEQVLRRTSRKLVSHF